MLEGGGRDDPLALLLQAQADAEGEPAVVYRKRSREPWVAILILEDLLQ